MEAGRKCCRWNNAGSSFDMGDAGPAIDPATGMAPQPGNGSSRTREPGPGPMEWQPGPAPMGDPGPGPMGDPGPGGPAVVNNWNGTTTRQKLLWEIQDQARWESQDQEVQLDQAQQNDTTTRWAPMGDPGPGHGRARTRTDGESQGQDRWQRQAS